MSSTMYTSCPVVRAETMKLFERVEVAGKDTFIPFEQKILWIRQSEAKVIMAHRGMMIRDIDTLSDHYGYLTSGEQAITGNEDVPILYRNAKLDPTSDLCVEVFVKIEEIPVSEDLSREGVEHNAHKNYRRRYMEVPSYYNGNRWWYASDIPQKNKPDDRWAFHQRLERKTVMEIPLFYSTLHRTDIGTVPPHIADWLKEMRKPDAGLVPFPSI